MIRDYKIVLASASPRRRELLNQISLNPVIEPSTVVEVITTRVPEDAVMELSLQKSRRCGKASAAWYHCNRGRYCSGG